MTNCTYIICCILICSFSNQVLQTKLSIFSKSVIKTVALNINIGPEHQVITDNSVCASVRSILSLRTQARWPHPLGKHADRDDHHLVSASYVPRALWLVRSMIYPHVLMRNRVSERWSSLSKVKQLVNGAPGMWNWPSECITLPQVDVSPPFLPSKTNSSDNPFFMEQLRI